MVLTRFIASYVKITDSNLINSCKAKYRFSNKFRLHTIIIGRKERFGPYNCSKFHAFLPQKLAIL